MQHSEIQELVPLYALGGISEHESALVAQHLAVCPSCRALLNEYQFIGDEMLAQVPLQTAPAYLGVRLQNLVQADARQARHAIKPNVTAPTAKPPRFWNQPLSLPRWALVLALLAFLFLAAAAGVMAFRLQENNAAQLQMLALLTSNRIKYVELTGGTNTPEDFGFLCVNQNNSNALLWLHDLAQLDHDHVYQVWLRNGTLRDNGGTFRADYDGRAMILLRAPRPLTDYTEIGITIEPAAGSQGPTTPRVIGGKLD